MSVWTNRIALAAVVVLTVWLAATSVPSWTSGHLGGGPLLQHLVASGGFVIVLPLYAVLGLGRRLDPTRSNKLDRIGFWTLIGTAFLTIATIFICMLPVASSEMMGHLIRWHGYVGFATLAALVFLLIALVPARRRSRSLSK